MWKIIILDFAQAAVVYSFISWLRVDSQEGEGWHPSSLEAENVAAS